MPAGDAVEVHGPPTTLHLVELGDALVQEQDTAASLPGVAVTGADEDIDALGS
jgi:hypothetical protein